MLKNRPRCGPQKQNRAGALDCKQSAEVNKSIWRFKSTATFKPLPTTRSIRSEEGEPVHRRSVSPMVMTWSPSSDRAQEVVADCSPKTIADSACKHLISSGITSAASRASSGSGGRHIKSRSIRFNASGNPITGRERKRRHQVYSLRTPVL